jgi:protocatechuate 4,5-dioxygenase alpha chain
MGRIAMDQGAALRRPAWQPTGFARAKFDSDQNGRPAGFNSDACNKETDMRHHIEGTTLFDGDQAQKGYALNRMCFSFNSAANRAAFLQDEDAYCAKFHLTKQQRAAVKSRNVLQLIEAGGNVYYLAKLAGIFGLSVQDIGAQQTGMSVEAFKHKLAVAGR